MDTYDIFIAHADADTQAAEMLFDFLSAECGVFLDTRSICLGDDWDCTLTRAQKSSRITVVMVSANSGSAYYQREEIATAIAMARSGSHRVVPILLHPTSRSDDYIPYGLRLKHGISARGKHGLYLAAKRLIELLNHAASASTLRDSEGPKIDNATVLLGHCDTDVGFEILVANHGQTRATITEASVGCQFQKDEDHFAPLPCHTSVIHLEMGEAMTGVGNSVSGFTTEQGDPWGRPIEGIVSVAGQTADLEFSFPMYRTLEVGEFGLIRFVFKSPIVSPIHYRPAQDSGRFERFSALLESSPFFAGRIDVMPGRTWIVLEGDWGEPAGAVIGDHSLLNLLGVLEGRGASASVKVPRPE